MSLKVVKFDTKMYLNFSIFGGTNLGWGGDKPWSKNGDKCLMGGIGKIFAGWGYPPRKKTLADLIYSSFDCKLILPVQNDE